MEGPYLFRKNTFISYIKAPEAKLYDQSWKLSFSKKYQNGRREKSEKSCRMMAPAFSDSPLWVFQTEEKRVSKKKLESRDNWVCP